MSCVRYIFSFLQISPRQAGDDAAGDSDTVQNVTRERHAQRNAFDIWQSPQCTVGRASRQRAKGRALLVFSQIVECSALFACAFFTFISVLFFLYLYTLIVCSVRSFLYVPFPFVCFGFFRFSDYFYVFNLERWNNIRQKSLFASRLTVFDTKQKYFEQKIHSPSLSFSFCLLCSYF